MNGRSLLSGLANKLALFVLVYAGLYLSVTSIGIAVDALSGGGGSDLDAILLGLVALVAIVGMSIGAHFLTKWTNVGWNVLLIATPFLAACGAIAVQFSSWGAVLVATFAPCLLMLLHPGRASKWTKAVLGFDDGALAIGALGISGAILLAIVDEISLVPCQYTGHVLTYASVGAGTYFLIRTLVIGRAGARPTPVQAEAKHVTEVAPSVAVTAYSSMVSWSLSPVVIVLALKQLALFSSYESSLDATTITQLSLLAFAGGACVVAILGLLPEHQQLRRAAGLAFLAILGTCTATLTLASGSLDGNAVVATRLLSFFSIPGTLMAMLGIRAPHVKGTAFHFWNGFMVVVGIFLLIAGIAFEISNADTYFLVVYLAAISLTSVQAIIPLATGHVMEVRAS
ncbi:MAG: hypothetical protein JW839_19735 [Candidatus Lokiarchaeota archaeon]|nr:hypothetical protein [Candidatus Lokiarchaeota archaeon]